MTHLSTHVLDAVTGLPAVGVAVTLTDSAGAVLANAATDDDGRIAGLAAGELSGHYRLTFDTGAYFASAGIAGFYPEVVIAFEVTEPTGRYHVPLLLSPYAYSTYRGS
ncbi:hydroxyisourate hydrolase [Mycobacterium simulans]|nr:hydroxyisourate hydrolase [Mycobacterium simulans]